MFEGMPQTEQKQQQGTFRPLPQRRGTDRRHQHQEVDFETASADVLHGFTRWEVATE